MQRRSLTRRGVLGGGAAIAAAPLVAASNGVQTGDPGWSARKQFRTIDGVRMAWHEVGEGDPIVFLHGNPTSSYLWRKVIPHVADLGRCIAPDLVGMGDSGKLDDSGPGVYTFVNHQRYLYALLDSLGVEKNVTLVIHDWGSGLGFNWAYQRPDAVRGIAYMEALLRPPQRDDAAIRPSPFFVRLRSDSAEKLILEDNMFVERMLLQEIDLYTSDEDKAEYRRPFLEPGESRRPTLTWPRELVIDGDPEINDRIIRDYSAWLAESTVPKLFVRAVPGAIFQVPPLLAFARSLPNQTEVQVYGGHFVQEVSGDAIGRALARWIPGLS